MNKMNKIMMTLVVSLLISANTTQANPSESTQDKLVSKYETKIFEAIKSLESAKTQNNSKLVNYYQNKLINLVNELDKVNLTDHLANKLF